ncbi:MAG: 4Fe-4S dicluster domain-containing protein [Bacteroidales bacterium]|jgi:NAD-dependent dihydropyrimidine dehydrogenase PreA subunit|nr:4Fe-4S dicluster domain-containing protein [Bacteroidales bacterium]
MKRTLIKIDEQKCTGCGLCVEGCHEGALQLIDGKARIISELYCDGLGACIGECPVGAIITQEQEAEPYDENAVMEKICPKGEKTIIAHLKHLKEHQQTAFFEQGVEYLRKHNIDIDLSTLHSHSDGHFEGCPGAKERIFAVNQEVTALQESPSFLQQWPIQLHLVSPQATFFRNADVLLAADCTAFALGNFHPKYLKNHALAIACPKLDSQQEIYVEKLTIMIEQTNINTLTIITMEVPCCSGLIRLAQKAASQAQRKIPLKSIVVSLDGKLLQDNWL